MIPAEADQLIAENKRLQEQLEQVRSELANRIGATERASARQRAGRAGRATPASAPARPTHSPRPIASMRDAASRT